MEKQPEAIGKICSEVRNTIPQGPHESPKAPCEKCGGSSWAPRGDGRVERCICALERIRKARLQVIEAQWPEFHHADLDKIRPRPKQRKALALIRNGLRGSWFISGYYGSGKTFLMIAQYRALILDGYPCIPRSARQLMEEIRRAEAPHSQGVVYGYGEADVYQSPVLALLNSPDSSGHLFIDDLEKAGARSEFRAEMLFYIFDTIMRRRMGLTITSNLPMSKIGPHIGEAAMARIERICRPIVL